MHEYLHACEHKNLVVGKNVFGVQSKTKELKEISLPGQKLGISHKTVQKLQIEETSTM